MAEAGDLLYWASSGLTVSSWPVVTESLEVERVSLVSLELERVSLVSLEVERVSLASLEVEVGGLGQGGEGRPGPGISGVLPFT